MWLSTLDAAEIGGAVRAISRPAAVLAAARTPHLPNLGVRVLGEVVLVPRRQNVEGARTGAGRVQEERGRLLLLDVERELGLLDAGAAELELEGGVAAGRDVGPHVQPHAAEVRLARAVRGQLQVARQRVEHAQLGLALRQRHGVVGLRAVGQ